MKYRALAVDYDGTLAHDGVVSAETVKALEQLRESGRYLILATGRELENLFQILPQLDLFHSVIAENGAVIYDTSDQTLVLNGKKPPAEFIQKLEEKKVGPFSVGHVIVATGEPHQSVVSEIIRDMKLELQVILNKGAVMVLPIGTDKASGLRIALKELRIQMDHVVAVGDAENDVEFLKLAGFSVAVSNALESVKNEVHFVTRGKNGAGVQEIIAELLSSDLNSLKQK